MCNQLLLIHNVLIKYNNALNKIYAPWFKDYQKYFIGDDTGLFCDKDFFDNNKESFSNFRWEDQSINLITDPFKNKELFLKKEYQDKVDEIIYSFNVFENLVAVHIRRGDYIEWENGKHFHEVSRYRTEAQDSIKKWGLNNYKILYFSDEQLTSLPEGVIIRDLSGNKPAIELFVMSKCNYFVHTCSTFSEIAMLYSKASGKYKNSTNI